MTTESIHVKRMTISLRPDQSRVLLRPFEPGNAQRSGRIVDRILTLAEADVPAQLNNVLADFSTRHQNISGVFRERFEQIGNLLSLDGNLSEARKLLIGSYFTCEYSLESAALFN